MKDIFYVLELTVEKCMAELYLNDIPIARRGMDCGYFYGVPVNEFIVNGKNEIALVLEPGDRPSHAYTGKEGQRGRFVPDKEAKITAILGTYPCGAVVGGPDRTELAAIGWTPDDGSPLMFPQVRSVRVDIWPPFAPWKWEQAPPITLDEETLGEIDAFIKDLHLSLSAAFHEPFLEKCTLRFSEIEQAHYLPPGNRASEARRVFPDIMDTPSWAMQPLQEIAYDLRLCARERMVQLISKDWQAILRQTPNEKGEGIFFSMFLSKIEGKWEVVR